MYIKPSVLRSLYIETSLLLRQTMFGLTISSASKITHQINIGQKDKCNVCALFSPTNTGAILEYL